MLWLWAWAAGATVACELRGFSVRTWLFSSSLMRFIQWGTVERLWTWKEASANNEREGPVEDVPGLCPAQLYCSSPDFGLWERVRDSSVYVKHQVCRAGKGEWRAGWRISVCLDFCFPMSRVPVTKLLQKWCRCTFILRYFLSMAQHSRQKKHQKTPSKPVCYRNRESLTAHSPEAALWPFFEISV